MRVKGAQSHWEMSLQLVKLLTEMPDVDVMTLGLTTDAFTARPTNMGQGAIEGKGQPEPSWGPWSRIDRWKL